MASKRNAKKNIDYTTYTVIHDCMTHLEMSNTPPKKEVYSIMAETINLRNELIKDVNNTPKESAKAHYKNIYTRLFKESEEAFKKLSNSIKQ